LSQVFISHAHQDEHLARKVAALLSDALGLAPTDFFLSSQEGRGVPPAAKIRDQILEELSSVPALVVLLTPQAACSPWVWIEAGHRLGCDDRSNPIFVVPSARFVNLLSPVADLRCLRLDDDGELHELVHAVGKSLGRDPADFLDYKPALDDLAVTTRAAYSPGREKRARAVSWLRSNVLALIFVMTALGALGYGRSIAAAAKRQVATVEDKCNSALNSELVTAASQYLVLSGKVVSETGNVHGATVMASRDQEVTDPSACREPQCTYRTTTTEGEFRIDLTKIQARNGDDIVLSIVKPGFRFFSDDVKVDIRAIDVRASPQRLTLDLQPLNAPDPWSSLR
jgi:hypothetical protein